MVPTTQLGGMDPSLKLCVTHWSLNAINLLNALQLIKNGPIGDPRWDVLFDFCLRVVLNLVLFHTVPTAVLDLLRLAFFSLQGVFKTYFTILANKGLL